MLTAEGLEELAQVYAQAGYSDVAALTAAPLNTVACFASPVVLVLVIAHQAVGEHAVLLCYCKSS
jgi:hypothetical protein